MTNDEQLMIELLSQWKLEAEFRNNYNKYIETEQWLFQQTRVKGIYFW